MALPLTTKSAPSVATCSMFFLVIPPSTSRSISLLPISLRASGEASFRARQELLPAPARVDGQEKNQLELVDKRFDHVKWRAGVQGDAADDTAARERLEHAVWVPGRLHVAGDDPCTGVDERLQLFQGLVDHQVAVLDEAVGDGFDDRWADRELWAEDPVHDVDVHHVGAGLVEDRQLVPELQEVRRHHPDTDRGPTVQQLPDGGLHCSLRPSSNVRSL